MRTPIIIVMLFVVGVLTYFVLKPKKDKPEEPKQQPLAVSKYSDQFNKAVSEYMNSYYSLSDALVKWDSAAVPALSQEAKSKFEAIPLAELQKDTLIHLTATSSVENFRNDFTGISSEPSLELKRRAFNSLSQNTYTFLQTVKFDREKIYLHECPMAFNDTETALWLAREGEDDKRRNPYLGLHHPRYHAGMLTCGETRDSLNFGGR